MGAPELLVVIVIGGLWGLPIWGIVDAARRPAAQWEMVRRSKAAWIVGMLLFGFVAALVYFASVRPGLRAGGYQPR